MEALLINSHFAVQLLAYLFLFAGMFLEGETIFFIAIYLAHQGLMSFSGVMVVSFLGMFSGDISWYKFGRRIESVRIVDWLLHRKAVQKTAESVDAYILKSLPLSVILAKFAYGIHRLILLRLSHYYQTISFRKFLKFDLLAIVIWIFFIGGVGRISWVAFFVFRKYLKFGELGLLLGFLFLIFLSRAIAKIGEKRIAAWKAEEHLKQLGK